jgi:hypothetical protein
MAFLTDYKYYENSGVSPVDLNHGSYQYINLVEIVKNFMSNYTGNNEVIRNVSRQKVIFEAKQAIKELSFDSLKEVKVLQVDVGADLKAIMPPDYVRYVRISIFKNGKLIPLKEDSKANWAKQYLKDNAGDLTFDGDGKVIYMAVSQLDQSRIDGQDGRSAVQSTSLEVCDNPITSRYGADPSELNAGPSFDIDRRSGVINFSSDASNQSFIIEYISDGMEGNNDTSIAVNKLFERYLYAKIAYEVVSSKMGIQEYIVRRYMKKARAEQRNASIRMKNFDPVNLLKALRSMDKRIK